MAISGKLLSGASPCQDGIVRDEAACCARCVSDRNCAGWQFLSGFDCAWLGYAEPQAVCRLYASVTGTHSAEDGVLSTIIGILDKS